MSAVRRHPVDAAVRRVRRFLSGLRPPGRRVTRIGVCVTAVVVVVALGTAWLVASTVSPDAAPPTSAPGSGPTAPSTRPSPSTSPSPGGTESPGPTPSPPRPPAGPPVGTVATAQRYLTRYDAQRVGWDDVLDQGRPIPPPDARCRQRWRASGKDTRLAWQRGRFWCLDQLPGRRWKPQGIAGSGTTEGYRIDGRAAAGRNIVLTSWYSRSAEKDLFASNHSGQSVTRLVVMDLDRQRYGIVELVRPEGADGFRNLNSHGSGLAWAGQYLYSSSRSWLWLYNADDLLLIDGHFVLPAVTRWSVGGSGGLSSISLDRSAGRDQLTGVNYTKTGTSRVQSFDLDPRGLLSTRPGRRRSSALLLTTVFGERRRVVQSVQSRTVPGTHYQGVGRWRRYSFSNSSSLPLVAGGPSSDAMVLLRDETVLQRFRMPGGNVESVYVDYQRQTYASLTEAGARFLFVLPLAEVVAAAGR